jgi:hypothetical protein
MLEQEVQVDVVVGRQRLLQPLRGTLPEVMHHSTIAARSLPEGLWQDDETAQ